MQIITLITDFGLDDHYVGLVKGALLSASSSLNIVDITHNIKNFDMVHASFVLKNTYAEFPKDTIHIINVKTFHEKRADFIIFNKEGYYFIGPDNGIFSLVFGDDLGDTYLLDNKEGGVFGLKSVYAQAVAHLLSDKPFHEIGLPVEKLERRISLQPVMSNGQLRGSVIHVDSYGNVVLNIDRKLFNKTCAGRKFSVFFKRTEPITELSNQYSDVPVGELLCLFNSADHLEIALNMDKAAEKYGLKVDDAVIIRLE